MKNNFLRQLTLSLLCISVFILSGCASKNTAAQGMVFPDKGIACKAANKIAKSYTVVAWSAEQSEASENALNDCKMEVGTPSACYVQNCWKTNPPPTNGKADGWVTCYVKDENQNGVWSSTSHYSSKAFSIAYKRCASMNGSKNACYLSYCRIW